MLVLVNALYLKASWVDVFHEERTAEERFTRLDGTEVGVPMMHGKSSSSGRQLGDLVAAHARAAGPGAELGLPRFEARFSLDLSPVFEALGLGALYRKGSPLQTGATLFVGRVLDPTT